MQTRGKAELYEVNKCTSGIGFFPNFDLTSFQNLLSLKNPVFSLAFFLLCTRLSAQNHTLILADKQTKIPIESANLKTKKNNFTSDASGKVAFKADPSDEIQISHISYLSVKILAEDLADTLFLEKATADLNEVIIRPKTIEILRPKKALGNLNPRNYGGGGAPLKDEIYALFVPNSTGKDFQLRAVSVEPTDYSIMDLAENASEKQKDQKFSPFKISIYSVDPKFGIPDKPMLESEITVHLSPGQKFATVRFSEEISIGSDGFFIVLTPFSSEHYQQIGFRSAPAFNTIQGTKAIPQLFLTKNTRIENGIWKQTIRNRDFNELLSYRIEVAY